MAWSAVILLAGCADAAPIDVIAPALPVSAQHLPVITAEVPAARMVERTFEGPLTGCSLHVRSRFAGAETGTMHYAEQVTLRVGSGEPMDLVSDLEAGELAPIVQQAHDLGGTFLVLGWSSWGGGAQTNSALIVDARACAGLRLVDRLDVSSSRARAGLLVDVSGGSVGVPLHPPEQATEFTLTFGRRTVRADELRAFTTAQVQDAAWYAPPAAAETQAPASAVQAVWFSVTADGFHARPR